MLFTALIGTGAIVLTIFFIKHLKYKKALKKYRMGYNFISEEYLIDPPKDISPAIVDYLYIKIKGHEVLTNEFYNEKLQWEAYKTYLLKLAANDFKMTLESPDYPFIYGPALNILDEKIEKLVSLMPKNNLTTNAYITNYFAYNMLFTSLSTDSASSSSNISSGSSFSGGGGGGSGAF